MTYESNSGRRTFLKAAGIGGTALLAGCLGTLGQGGDENGDEAESNAGEAESNAGEGATQSLNPAQDVDVDRIAADPTDVPDPIDRDEPAHLEWELQTEELVAEIEPGVTHRFMTFEGQIPGPLLRARVGDTVHLTFDVPDDLNQDIHNVDFHAVYGPGGGAVDTTIAPGEGPAEIEFSLEYPGAHIYHCAPGQHDYHISTGMFGTILVEPEDGLPEVDREFYVGQHELYTNGDTGEEGHHQFDFDAAAAEDPTYVLFNGEVAPFTEEGPYDPIHAEVGETVRLFWCNGGPNLTSSPHPIGNVFKRWYDNGDVTTEPSRWVEGAALGAGFSAFGDMELPVPGPVYLVDHALSRVTQKGLFATIDVEGEPDEEIYNGDP